MRSWASTLPCRASLMRILPVREAAAPSMMLEMQGAWPTCSAFPSMSGISRRGSQRTLSTISSPSTSAVERPIPACAATRRSSSAQSSTERSPWTSMQLRPATTRKSSKARTVPNSIGPRTRRRISPTSSASCELTNLSAPYSPSVPTSSPRCELRQRSAVSSSRASRIVMTSASFRTVTRRGSSKADSEACRARSSMRQPVTSSLSTTAPSPSRSASGGA